MKDHTPQQIEEMAQKNGGYFGLELSKYEKKYWEAFECHGFDKLELVNEVIYKNKLHSSSSS